MPDDKLVSAGLRVFFDAQINRIAVWGGVALMGWGFWGRVNFGSNDSMAIGVGTGMFVYGSMLAIWREQKLAEREREVRAADASAAHTVLPLSNTEQAFLDQFTDLNGYAMDDLRNTDFDYAVGDENAVNVFRLSMATIKGLTMRGYYTFEGGRYTPTTDNTVIGHVR
eukprot:GHVR01099699.1.p1 GENE.GHVR01099699.1~~GHVR01099699.1.p1  ORF type:complete len:168 (-),score=30.71 GHVR01099699.1:1185-1688(-)